MADGNIYHSPQHSQKQQQPLFSLMFINRAGGLIWHREFREYGSEKGQEAGVYYGTGNKAGTAERLLTAAGMLHSLSAIAERVVRQPAQKILDSEQIIFNGEKNDGQESHVESAKIQTKMREVATVAAIAMNGSRKNQAIGNKGAGESHTIRFPGKKRENVQLLPQGNTAGGINTIEMPHARLVCYQAATGLKIVACTTNTVENAKTEKLLHALYALYTDYVLKNPFYEIDMPIRAQQFDQRAMGLLIANGSIVVPTGRRD